MLAAALGVSRVREIHNLVVLDVDGRVEASLHLKLPGELPLEDAHAIAEQVERAICSAVPEVEDVRTHLEPLTEAASAQEVAVDAAAVERAVREETGAAPRELRFVRTDDGLVAFLTLALAGNESLTDAHARASAVEERVRAAVPGRRRVVHTEPMKLCMFHPVDHPMERGWVGRVDGDRIVELAAQTLQAYFTGGGAAREHAFFPLSTVQLLAPVLHPPAVRIFDAEASFEFANPAAIMGPNTEVAHRTVEDSLPLELRPRVAAVIGGRGEISGFTILADWRAPGLPRPKDRDFALGLGPVVVTPDEVAGNTRRQVRVLGDVVVRGRAGPFDWAAARDFAAADTTLRPGRHHRRPGVRRGRGHRAGNHGRRRDRRDRSAVPVGAVVRRDPMKLVLDWDGTVTEVDGLHLVLQEFGDERLYDAAESKLGRELTLNEVISLEFESVSAPLDQVVAWMRANVVVRPGFAELARAHDPLIVSSGFRELIEPILEREGLELELVANRVEARPEGWRARFRESAACEVCGEGCKRSDVAGLDGFVYAGDGFSDRCVALAASRVFARAGLARYLEARGVAFEPFDDFHDLLRAL